jgi:glycopeptide antibiotics resistance protein
MQLVQKLHKLEQKKTKRKITSNMRSLLHIPVGVVLGFLTYTTFGSVAVSTVIVFVIGLVFELMQKHRSMALPKYLQGQYDIIDVLLTGAGGLFGALLALSMPEVVGCLHSDTIKDVIKCFFK